tara:strand:- start:2077 stop:2226 length:150 start_codon:yes stop_codon:yes gene_type:complete
MKEINQHASALAKLRHKKHPVTSEKAREMQKKSVEAKLKKKQIRKESVF